MKTKHFNWFLMASIILGSLFVSCSKDVPTFDTSKETHKKELKEINVNELLSVPIKSIDVSIEQAISAVRNKNQSPSLGALQKREVESTFELKTKEGKPALYVINYTPKGYAIVSATRKYTPIISYNLDGHISLKGKTNAVIKNILDDYVNSIEHASALPDSLTRSALMQWEMLGEEKPVRTRLAGGHDEDMFRKVSLAIEKYNNEGYRVYRYGDIMEDYYYYREKYPWDFPGAEDFSSNGILSSGTKAEIYRSVRMYATKEYDVNSYVLILLKEVFTTNKVEEMLSTRWGQDKGYNDKIPNNYPVGCGALAVAQIMKYHRYPKSFNWDAMPDNVSTNVTAQFLKDVADGIETEFTKDGSKSSTSDSNGYLRSMGYSTEYLDSEETSMSKIFYSLNKKFPIFARGKKYGEKDGHAFIIDGYESKYSKYEICVMSFPDAPLSYLKEEELGKIYDVEYSGWGGETKFHLNLGWGGYYNGMYDFNSFLGYDNNRRYIFITPPSK